jgi:AcrR family transcriptional regulator
MMKKSSIEKNSSTEEKIKEAARKVFTQKGYAATRTRDIAEEAGYNLALLNYYFRSKEKLFDIVCLENIQLFIPSVIGIINDPNTSLQEKIEILVSNYIDMLMKNPELPLFILSEIHKDPMKLLNKVWSNNIRHENAYIIKQWQEFIAKSKGPSVNPIHIFINALSMMIFPFAASPLLRNRTGMSKEEFNKLMTERKKLIPIWIGAMLNIK